MLSAEEQAALKKQAEDLLAGLLTLQDRLTTLNAQMWASEDWQRYQALSEAGDNEFLANDFAAAVASYSDATSLGDAIIARAAADVERSFNAGEAALYAGNAELAIEQYDLVLTIEPAHAAALAQRARAERLPEVLAIVQRADSERERGELTTALASYREALAIDAGWALATDGVNDVSRALRDAEFERLLSDAYSMLGEESFTEAQERFRTALAVRPDSREAQEGLVQAEQGAKLDQIALTEARALAFERRELWDQAIELYRSMLASDETLLFAQTGLERAQARAGLDAKLANLIDNPSLLLTDAVLADARKLLDAAGAEEPRGPRLTGQLEQLGGLIALAVATGRRAPHIGSIDHGDPVSCRHTGCIRVARARASAGYVYGHRQPRRLPRRAPDVHGAAGRELTPDQRSLRRTHLAPGRDTWQRKRKRTDAARS